MWFKKNVAGQGCYLLAVDTVTKLGKTGLTDIVANVSLDGGLTTPAANNASIVEVGGGLYWLPFSQAETNANKHAVIASSVTSNVAVYPYDATSTQGVLPTADVGGSGGLPTYDNVAAVSTGLATSGQVAANTTHLTEIKGAGFGPTFALDQTTGLAAVVAGILNELLSGYGISGSVGASLKDRYWAKFIFVGGVTTDKYRSIRWYKNDEPLDSGVTLPLLRVVDADTGDDLIAETALTQAGTSHLFSYDGTGAELTTSGKAYAIRMKATIDGAVRPFEDGFYKV